MEEERLEDFQVLVRFLERTKLSRATAPEEWRLLEELGMQDVMRRYQEAWAFLCRRGITQLLRRRERAAIEEARHTIDAVIVAVQRVATSP